MECSISLQPNRSVVLSKLAHYRPAGSQAAETQAARPKLRQRALTTAICGALAIGLQAALTQPAQAQTFPASIELSSLDGNNGFVINGERTSDNAGFAVSAAGDINGDGIDDLIIGSDRSDFSRGLRGNEPGRTYVVFGVDGGLPAAVELSSLNGNNGFAIDGEAPFDSSGTSVSALGDINGDGIDDLMIGAASANANGNLYAGQAYVVFGDRSAFPAVLDVSSLDGSNGFVINGENQNDYAGRRVSGAGDINGDGLADLMLSAPRADPNGISSGRSYVIFGTSSGFPAALDLSNLDGSNGFFINGEAPSNYSGYGLSAAGDVNGDGVDDLILGADDISRSYVVFGSSSGLPASLELSSINGSNGFVLNGGVQGNTAGAAVSAAGDVNGDEIDDLIIGAPFADLAGDDTGRSFVVFGRASGFPNTIDLSGLNGSDGFALNGETANDRAGASVSGVGDINGDGIDDVIIGARAADPNGSGSGRSYVVLGTRSNRPAMLDLANLDGTNGFALNGEAINNQTGRSVSDAGDINGDGIHDLIIGAPNASPNGNSSGRSYVVFGRDIDLVFRDGFETGL